MSCPDEYDDVDERAVESPLVHAEPAEAVPSEVDMDAYLTRWALDYELGRYGWRRER